METTLKGMQMKSLDEEFTKNFLEVKKTVEALNRLLKSSAEKLPDDITVLLVLAFIF